MASSVRKIYAKTSERGPSKSSGGLLLLSPVVVVLAFDPRALQTGT